MIYSVPALEEFRYSRLVCRWLNPIAHNYFQPRLCKSPGVLAHEIQARTSARKIGAAASLFDMQIAKATIAVLILCSDRFEELIRGLKSLELIEDLISEVRVLKNAPKVEWKPDALASLPPAISKKLVIIESAKPVLSTEGRNIIAEKAKGDLFLFIDDDSYLLESSGIRKGCDILMSNPDVGSVAYPQCDAKGHFPQNSGQPAPVDYACYTCGFMTCGALVRSDVYRQLHGFQEMIGMAHGENEFCKRQWDAGYAVVYLPERSICHVPSPVARNMRQRALLTARNSWFQAVLHEPLWLLVVSLPARIVRGALYLRGAREWLQCDWKPVFRDALTQFVKSLPALIQRRKPLKAQTFRRWQKIKRSYPRFELQRP